MVDESPSIARAALSASAGSRLSTAITFQPVGTLPQNRFEAVIPKRPFASTHAALTVPPPRRGIGERVQGRLLGRRRAVRCVNHVEVLRVAQCNRPGGVALGNDRALHNLGLLEKPDFGQRGLQTRLADADAHAVGRRGRAQPQQGLKPTVVHSLGRLFSRIGCAATHFDPSHVSKENDSMRWPRWSTASCIETTLNVRSGQFQDQLGRGLARRASHQVSRLPSRASEGGYAGWTSRRSARAADGEVLHERVNVSPATTDLAIANWLSRISCGCWARGSAARRRSSPPTGNTCRPSPRRSARPFRGPRTSRRGSAG